MQLGQCRRTRRCQRRRKRRLTRCQRATFRGAGVVQTRVWRNSCFRNRTGEETHGRSRLLMGGAGKHQRSSNVRRGRIVVGVVCAQTTERQSLVLALRAVGDIEAVDCGAGQADSIARVRDLGIGVVLLALDAGPAASFAASVLSVSARARPVSLLRTESESALARLAAAGVVGFIQVGADLMACSRALRTVHRRGAYCPPSLAAVVLRSKPSRAPWKQRGAEPPNGRLHGRRLEVAECIVGGLSNKEISSRLGIAEGTVKNHVHAVLLSLSVAHRWEVSGALHHGAHLGLVPPPSEEERR